MKLKSKIFIKVLLSDVSSVLWSLCVTELSNFIGYGLSFLFDIKVFNIWLLSSWDYGDSSTETYLNTWVALEC